jgi:hypothetical protein
MASAGPDVSLVEMSVARARTAASAVTATVVALGSSAGASAMESNSERCPSPPRPEIIEPSRSTRTDRITTA